jgi:hypothetical protein
MEPVLIEMNLEPKRFKAWLKKSTPRQILFIGRNEKPDLVDWFWYTTNILTIAGYWNPGRYGAYAYLDVNPTWWLGNLYHVPAEQYIVEEDLLPDMGRRTLRCMPEQAVEAALAGDVVEKRYAWTEDKDSILRVACDAFNFAAMKSIRKLNDIRKVLDANTQYSFFSGEDL